MTSLLTCLETSNTKPGDDETNAVVKKYENAGVAIYRDDVQGLKKLLKKGWLILLLFSKNYHETFP